MKQVSGERMKKRNLRLVCLCLAAFAILMVFLSLPAYTFDTSLYTKKSGNTFVGDERYVSARAEADAAAAQFTAQGASNVRVTEDVLTRKNSKGETTSMITFRVSTDVARTGWQFLFSAMVISKFRRSTTVSIRSRLASAACTVSTRSCSSKKCRPLILAAPSFTKMVIPSFCNTCKPVDGFANTPFRKYRASTRAITSELYALLYNGFPSPS